MRVHFVRRQHVRLLHTTLVAHLHMAGAAVGARQRRDANVRRVQMRPAERDLHAIDECLRAASRLESTQSHC